MAERFITSAFVIERVEMYRIGLVNSLRKCGITITGETQSAIDGMRDIEHRQPQLVLIGDVIDLPLIDAVLKLRRHQNVAIAAIVSSTRAARDLAAAGADAVIARNMQEKDLEGAIETIRDGEFYVAPEYQDVAVTGVAPDRSEIVRGVLSLKETQVLALVARGMRNKDIAEEMTVGAETVKTHLRHIYSKLNVSSRRDAVARAVALGLLG